MEKIRRSNKQSKKTCLNSSISEFEHFVGIDKMVQIGSGAERKQQDYQLTRYACYLIVQNGDSRKKVIALAQTYFAVQTRKLKSTELKNYLFKGSFLTINGSILLDCHIYHVC